MRCLIAVTAIAMASGAFAQESAKALFHDPTSGVSLQASGQALRPTSSAKPGSTNPTGSPTANQAASQASLPEVTGLMYWVELQTDRGQLLRVNSIRIFRSGERIRLHISSNVDGQLTILQSQDSGPFTRLFPAKLGSAGRVQKHQPNVFPSASGWFRFDEKPGDLRLMLMVQAGSESVPVRLASSGQTQVPGDRDLEAQVRAQIDQLKGSKALVVEEDSSTAEPAMYTVVDARKAEGVPKGLVALEMKLTHR